MKLPFGKHKGEEICDVPLDYLKWLEAQPWLHKNVREEIQFVIKVTEGDVGSLGRVVPGKIKLV